MKTRIGAALALLLLTVVPAGLGSAGSAGAQANCQLFKETGKQVCGAFLAYWQSHGGLALQGFPVSSELQETSEVNGKSYTVQYFERAVFEAHPENQPPYNVLLSLLGAMRLKVKYPDGLPTEVLMPGSAGDKITFPQTGRTVSGAFLAYWQSHGGLSQFGYPISYVFNETSDLDGKQYAVQYFERAVFEAHPENQSPYRVLLSQLGTFRYREKYPPAQGQPLAQGSWGGNRAELLVNQSGGRIEFGCAHGTLDGPIIVSSDGHFDVTGTYVSELPVQPSQMEQLTHPARYTGVTDGTTLTLTVTLTDLGRTVGTFVLQFGVQPKIVKCM